MPLQVLIVDDSPAMHKTIAHVLRLSNDSRFIYCKASDGLKALSMPVTLRVGVIQTDTHMLHGSKKASTEWHVKGGKDLPAPILVLSVDYNEECISRMLKQRVSGYTEKPFTPESFNATLASIMEDCSNAV